MKTYLLATAAIAFGSLASGCGSGDHYGSGSDDSQAYSDYGDLCPLPGPTKAKQVDIDTDQTLTADPGTGVFVEYAAGGAYHVFTTCDTAISGFDCRWTLTAGVDPTLSLDAADDGTLESDDAITRIDKGAVRLEFLTQSDSDGVTLTVPAGETLRLSTVLDGCYDDRFVNWAEDGTVESGAPSDPIDFGPTTP